MDELTARIEPLEVAFHRAYWDSQIEANPETERARADLELQLRRVKGDTSALREVQEALDEEIHEPELRRQLEVLRLSFTGNQMEEAQRQELVELSTAVEGQFATFRPEVDGHRMTENDIDDVLRSSEDEGLRQKVWRASKEIGALAAPRVRELARLRNAAARDLGYPDYYRMALDLQEMSETWLFGLLDQLERLTLEPFRAWKDSIDGEIKERFGVSDLYPWHYADPFFQALPLDPRVDLDPLFGNADAAELAVRSFARWGIDLTEVMARSDLHPREGKCQHAFCLDVDRSGDVRILANVVAGERWVEVMLHESGHAAYDVCISPHLPYLLRRAAHTFVTEAIAIVCGRLARDPRWLTEVAQLDPARVEPMAGALGAADAVQSLLFARWVLVMAHFERDLYSDPEGDLDETWWSHVERFQLLQRPDDAPRGAWGAKIHLAAAPVYYHNYLLGELLATQLRETVEGQGIDFVSDPSTGRFLTERVFASGNSMRWDRLVESATGSPLSARPFVDSVTERLGAYR